MKIKKIIIAGKLDIIAQRTGIKYTKEIKIGSRRARAYINPKTKTIVVCDSWFGCSSEYQVAILYHEIFHILNDLPVAFNDDGKKFRLKLKSL